MEAADMAIELKELEEMLGAPLEMVGSRVICPNALRPNSDWDYLVLVKGLRRAVKLLVENDFVCGTSLGAHDTLNSEGQIVFASLKRGLVNVIATDDEDWHKAFLLANRTATMLGLTVKSQRILLFQAILYGNG